VTEPVVEIRELTVEFEHREGFRRVQTTAVNDVDLEIGPGETLGLVGESGSGKTTIGRAILRLLTPSAGHIRVADHDVTGFGTHPPLDFRRSAQVVFQDPLQSLNPRHRIGRTLGEALTIHLGIVGEERDEAVVGLLERVGLRAEHQRRYPTEFSGGQLQRIAIARALAPKPELIVMDEAVSALDATTTARILALFEELHTSTTAYLFIAHDLAVVRHISDRIAVMYRGRIVEIGTADEICDRPQHPYTQLLVRSIPDPDPVIQRQRREKRGQAESTAVEIPTDGCPFRPRCDLAVDACASVFPAMSTIGTTEVACHVVASNLAKSPA